MCRGVHGRIADGAGTGRAVGDTVGFPRTATDGPGKGPSRCGAGAMRRPAAGIISEGRAPRRREGERCGRPWHSLPCGSGPRVRSPGCRSSRALTVSTGSHDVRAGYAAGSCPDPSQRSAPALCSITLRSRRRGTARPQTAHRPVAASLTSRARPVRPVAGRPRQARPATMAALAAQGRRRWWRESGGRGSWAADQRVPAGRIITGSHPQSRSSEAATRS